MSDYIPNNPNPNDPRNYDKYGNTRFEPLDDGGSRGPYVLLGILVAIGLIGGLLYFNGTPKGSDVARAPGTTMERTLPATPAPMPAPAKPAVTPAPAAPAAPADQPVKQ